MHPSSYTPELTRPFTPIQHYWPNLPGAVSAFNSERICWEKSYPRWSCKPDSRRLWENSTINAVDYGLLTSWSRCKNSQGHSCLLADTKVANISNNFANQLQKPSAPSLSSVNSLSHCALYEDLSHTTLKHIMISCDAFVDNKSFKPWHNGRSLFFLLTSVGSMYLAVNCGPKNNFYWDNDHPNHTIIGINCLSRPPDPHLLNKKAQRNPSGHSY